MKEESGFYSDGVYRTEGQRNGTKRRYGLQAGRGPCAIRMHNGLIGREDIVYTRNRLYTLLELDGPEEPLACRKREFLTQTLGGLCGFA